MRRGVLLKLRLGDGKQLEVGTHAQCEARGAALRLPGGRRHSAGQATKCQQVGVGIEERVEEVKSLVGV